MAKQLNNVKWWLPPTDTTVTPAVNTTTTVSQPNISNTAKLHTAITMPEVSTNANAENDFPVFNTFRKKYGYNDTFGFDKLQNFYERAVQYNDSEALQDYQNVINEAKAKIGQKALYSAMAIHNQHIVNDEAIRNEQHMQGISDAMEAIVKGQGAGAFLNPVGIIGGIDEATKLGNKSQDLLSKGDIAGGLLTGLQSGLTGVFNMMMASSPEGIAYSAAMGYANAFMPKQSKWLSPITTLANPQTPTGQALAGLADVGLQFVGLHLIHSFGTLRDKVSSQSEDIIADNTQTQIRGLLQDKNPRFIAGQTGETGIADLDSQKSTEQTISKMKLQHSDLTTKVADVRQQLYTAVRSLKKTTEKGKRAELAKQIKSLQQSLEDTITQRNAIDDNIRAYGGLAQSTENVTKIRGLISQYSTYHEAPEGQGENVPSNINFSHAVEPGAKNISNLADKLHPVYRSKEELSPEENNKLVKYDIPYSSIDNILRFSDGSKLVFGKNGEVLAGITPDGQIVKHGRIDLSNVKSTIDEVLQNRKEILQLSLPDIPDEDKPAIENELKETQKAIDINAKGSQTQLEAQGSTIGEKSIDSKGTNEIVERGASKEEIQNKPKGLISDDAYNKAKDRFNSLNTDINVNPALWYAQHAADLLTMGAYHFQNGLIRFSEWYKTMIDKFGEDAKPYLASIWNQIQSDPSLSQIRKDPDSFNPTEQKFISTNSPSKTISHVAKTLSQMRDIYENFAQTAFPVIRQFGNDPYADVIKGIHLADKAQVIFGSTKSKMLDANFNEIEKMFNKYPKEMVDIFNKVRGKAKFAEGKKIQQQASIDFKKLPAELQSPKLMGAIQEMTDLVYNMAKERGMNLDYIKDYFYGSFKSAKATDAFFDYWKTTDKYTKEKTLPTIADAIGWGEISKQPMELKNYNPVTNIKEELSAVMRRIGMMDIDKINTDGNASYAVDMGKEISNINKKYGANTDIARNAIGELQGQYSDWQKIHDPVFKDKLYQPDYARFVNSLIKVNKISSAKTLATLRTAAFTFQTIKFAGSMFHMGNMLKQSIVAENNNWYKGIKNFGEAFKKYDATDPEYQNYVGLGLGHSYSLQSQVESAVTKSISSIADKLGVGDGLRKLYGQTKYIPVSPEFIKWMFEDYIPTLKFNRWKMDVAKEENSLNRPLTDGEKIAQGRKIQQFFGEMNERLYGRSGTVTSAMRLIFMAPGYGEGNFRTALSAANIWADIKDTGQHRDNLKYVINSLIASATLASVGTLALTGKLPDMPKSLRDVRDLFKIKTGAKDANGDDLYIDTMTYDKDFWALYGNSLTGQPFQTLTDVANRVSGATSEVIKTAVDLGTIFTGGKITDFNGHRIYEQNDNPATKIAKYLAYNIKQSLPISISTLTQAKTKGVSTIGAIAGSIIGARTTYSEKTKLVKQMISEAYSMQDSKEDEQINVDKQALTDPEGAVKEVNEFNDKQVKRIDEIAKELNLPVGSYERFIIKSINLPKQEPAEEKLEDLFSIHRRRKRAI